MKSFKLKTGPRVLAAFSIMLLVVAAMTLLAMWRLAAANETTNFLVHDRLAKQQLASEWLGAVQLNGTRTMAIAKADSLENADFFQAQLGAGEKIAGDLRDRLRKLASSPDEQAILARVTQAEGRYLAVRKEMFSFKDSGRVQDVERLATSTLGTSFTAYAESMSQMLEFQSREARAMADQSSADYRSSRGTLMAFGLLALTLGALLAWLLTRSIIRPLDRALTLANRVAEGDLRQFENDDHVDEIGQLMGALHKMTTRLAAVVTQVRYGAQSIDAASRELASGNMDLSQRTEHQASALEETASSMSELTSVVRQNSQSAREANHLAQSASGIAAKGGTVVRDVVDTMDTISTAAKKIVDIISVIDGIAFQTNILALNAAVEAARAGEQGRGFAVVASEVRNLAQRSATAAREIKDLIGDSANKIDIGTTLAHAAGDTMSEIVASVEHVTAIIGAISRASADQDTGIREISAAISGIDDDTQRNAALVEEAASTAEAVHKEAERLTQLVAFFRTDQMSNASSGHLALSAPGNHHM